MSQQHPNADRRNEPKRGGWSPNDEPVHGGWSPEDEEVGTDPRFDPRTAKLDNEFDPSTAKLDDGRPAYLPFDGELDKPVSPARRGGTRREAQTSIATPSIEAARGKGPLGNAATDPRRVDRVPDGNPLDSLNEQILQGRGPGLSDAQLQVQRTQAETAPWKQAENERIGRYVNGTGAGTISPDRAPSVIDQLIAGSQPKAEDRSLLGAAVGGAGDVLRRTSDVSSAASGGTWQLVKAGADLGRMVTGGWKDQGLLQDISRMADMANDVAQKSQSPEAQRDAAGLRSIISDPNADAMSVVGYALLHPQLVINQAAESAPSMALAIGGGRLVGALVNRASSVALGGAPLSAGAAARIAELSGAGARAGGVAGETAQAIAGVFDDVMKSGGSEGDAYRAAGLAAIGYAAIGRVTGGGTVGSKAAKSRESVLKEISKEGGEEYAQNWAEALGKTAGAGRDLNLAETNKQAISEGIVGAAMGAGGSIGTASYAAAPTYSAQQMAADRGFLSGSSASDVGLSAPSQSDAVSTRVPMAPPVVTSEQMPETPFTPADVAHLQAAADQAHAERLGIPKLAQHASLDGLIAGRNRPVEPSEAGNQGPGMGAANEIAPGGRNQAAGQVDAVASSLGPGEIARGSIASTAKRAVEARVQEAEGAADQGAQSGQQQAVKRESAVPQSSADTRNQQPAQGSSKSQPAAPNASAQPAATTTGRADTQDRGAQQVAQALPSFTSKGRAVAWLAQNRRTGELQPVKVGDAWTLQQRESDTTGITTGVPAGSTTAADQAHSGVKIVPRTDESAGTPAATHADPGHRAEPVTGQVVSASLTKAASSEGRRPYEIRSDLVGQIDKAMANAVADDHPDVVQYEREARSKPDRTKLQRQGLKGDMLERRANGVQNEIDQRKAAVAGRIGFVEFDVPGDGRFKVLNTKARLAEFKAKVMTSPGFKAARGSEAAPEYPGAQRGSASTKAAIEAMLDDGDAQAAVDYAAAKGIDIRAMGLSPQRLAKVAGIEPTKAPARADVHEGDTEADRRGQSQQRAHQQPDDARKADDRLSIGEHKGEKTEDSQNLSARPYELTQADFVKSLDIRNDGTGAKPWTISIGNTQLGGGQQYATRREAVVTVKAMHERSVRRAVAKGQAVPAAVRAEYSDLEPAPTPSKPSVAPQSGPASSTEAVPTGQPETGATEGGTSREAKTFDGLTVMLQVPNPETGQTDSGHVDAGRFIDDYDARLAALEAGEIGTPEDRAYISAATAELVKAGAGPTAAREQVRAELLRVLRIERAQVVDAARQQFPSAAAELDGEALAATPKKIEDAGEKIGGARKDRWKDRGLSIADLDGMTEAEGAELATKANVWKPGYETMVAAGARPNVAALVKVVFDSLAAKPKTNTPEGRRRYVTAMQAVREVYGNMGRLQQIAPGVDASDAVAMRRAAEELRQKLGVHDSDPVKARDAKTTLFSVYKGRSDPFSVGYAEEVRAAKLIDAGFPGKVEPWTRRFEISKSGGAGSTERGIAAIVKQSEDLGTPVTAEQAKAGVHLVIGKTDRRAKTMAATRADAEAAAQALYERDLAAKDDGKQAPERPHLDSLKREGLDKRIDRDVTADDFLQTFGFRGVEFGNWAANDERQRLLNMAFDGLHDLAEIIGVPPKALSLNGSMGMAFGARGGGRFAAHYEPGRLVINMTKLQGGGSLAHEFAHALDHYFGELDRTDAYQTKARGASGWYDKADYTGQAQRRFVQEGGKWVQRDVQSLPNLRPEVAHAFRGVMRALFQKQVGQAEMIRELELEIERTQARAESEQNPEVKAAIERRVKAQQQNLDESRGEPQDATYSRGGSDFEREARKLSGKSANGYWTRPTEMFARAFESFVFDKLLAMGAKSDYLVHGVESERFAGGNYKGNPYPVGTERADIDRAFERLFAAIKTRETDKGVAMFHRTQQGTPEFKAWFAGSKVVNADGSAKVMYHGTGADITAFRAKQAGAIFVTEEPIFAQAYADTSAKWMEHNHGQAGAANIMPVYVKAANPFDFESTGQVNALRAQLDHAGLWKTVAELDEQLGEPDNWAFLEGGPVQEAIKALGHDGFYVSEGGFKNLAVYDPTQVKSAIGNGGKFDHADSDVRMARLQDGRAATGLTTGAVRSIADDITEGWANAPGITVLASMADAPQAVRRADEQQRAGGASGVPAAFFFGGRVYLVAGQMRDAAAVEEAVLHEALGHAGLRGVFGEELGAVLDDLAKNRPGLVGRKASEYGLDVADPAHRRRAAEEVLAELAQTEPKSSFVQRALVAIRAWLRRVMPGLHDLQLSDAEIVARFIEPARNHIVSGEAGQAEASPAYMRSGQASPFYSQLSRSLAAAPINTAAPKAWADYIRGLASKGVKQDEVNWSGINEWLDMQGDRKVSKQEVLGYLDENGVKVEETILGRDEPYPVEVRHDPEGDAGQQWVVHAGDAELEAFATQEEAQDYAESYRNDPEEAAALNGTKYGGGFTNLPGGRNFRELVLRLPGRERFEPAHFDMPNALAYARTNERVDTVGRKILMVEELQSDWANQLRKAQGEAAAGDDEAVKTAADLDAPFVGKPDAWAALTIKRLVRYAVDNGFEGLAFISGKQAHERFRSFFDDNWASGRVDLGRFYGGADGQVRDARGRVTDRTPIVWNVAKSVIKRLGGDGMTTIELKGSGNADPMRRPKNPERGKTAQPGFYITPAMRDAVAAGLPLFARKDNGGSYGAFKQWLADNPDRDFSKMHLVNTEAKFEQPALPKPTPQNVDTKADEFRDWFDGSQVVDAAGNPLLVHGGANERNRFGAARNGPFGAGIYLSDDAGRVGHVWAGETVKPAYAVLRNPYIYEGAKFEVPGGWRLAQGGAPKSAAAGLIQAVMPEASAKQMLDRLRHGKSVFGDAIRKQLQSMGHDGLIVKYANPESGSTQYIAFHADQVMAATTGEDAADVAGSSEADAVQFQRVPADFTLREFGRAGRAVEVIQDRYNRWKQVIDDVRKQGGAITDENDFYKAEERYWGKVGTRLEAFYHDLKGFVNDVAKDGLSLDDVAIFAVAQHAEERNEAVARKRADMPDGGSGMTTDEADAILESARQAGLEPALKAHAETLRSWIQGTREVLRDGGLISDRDYAGWVGAYEHYVPLRGIDGQRLDFGANKTRYSKAGGFNVKGEEGHEAQGRHSQAKHIIETIVQDRARALVRVGKNEVLRSFAQFVIDNPSPKLWAIETVAAKDALTDDDAGDRVLEDQPAFSDDHTITLKDAGEEIRIQVLDDRLLRQLRHMDVEVNPSWVIGALQWANRKLSHIYTTLSPTFTVVNGLRDVQAAMFGMVDEIGFMGAPKLLAKMPMALYEAWRAEAGHMSADYQLYAAMGGQTHFFNLKTLDAQADELQRLVKTAERSPVDPRTIGHASLALIEAINGGIENATRLAAFKVARESGKSTVQAASIAKNLTVNFNRAGTQQLASAWILFFNPAVQDLAMGTRRLANPKVLATIGTAMLGIAALAIRNASMGDDDDGVAWWDKIPDETKERNIIVMLPPGSKAGEPVPGSKIGRYVKIPMPYYFSMFPVMANQIVDVWRHSQDPKRGRDLLHGAVKAFNGMMNAIMPVAEVGRALSSDSKEAAGKSLVLAAVPDALNPIAQNALNMNAFGRKLYPDGQRDRNMPDASTFFPGQAGTLFQRGTEALNKLTGGTKYSSGVVDVAPASMENLVRSYGGGPVGFALDLVNAMYARQSIARPELDAKKLPFVKQFYAQIDAETDRLTGYQRLEQAEKVTDPIKHAMRDGSAADARALFKEAGPMAGLGDSVLQTRQQLGQIIKAELQIVNNSTMADDIKFARLQALAERRRLVLQNFNRAYDRAIERTAMVKAEQPKAVAP